MDNFSPTRSFCDCESGHRSAELDTSQLGCHAQGQILPCLNHGHTEHGPSKGPERTSCRPASVFLSADSLRGPRGAMRMCVERPSVFLVGCVEELWSFLALFLWQFLHYEALLQRSLLLWDPHDSLVLVLSPPTWIFLVRSSLPLFSTWVLYTWILSA